MCVCVFVCVFVCVYVCVNEFVCLCVSVFAAPCSSVFAAPCSSVFAAPCSSSFTAIKNKSLFLLPSIIFTFTFYSICPFILQQNLLSFINSIIHICPFHSPWIIFNCQRSSRMIKGKLWLRSRESKLLLWSRESKLLLRRWG